MANTVAAAVRNRMFPPEDDADGAETVLETGRSSARTAPPGAYFLDLDERHPLRVNAPGAVRDETMCRAEIAVLIQSVACRRRLYGKPCVAF